MDEAAAAEGVSSTVTHIVYTHHHSDHAGASSIFGTNVTRIGHEECRRLLLRDELVQAVPSLDELLAHTQALGARHVGYGVRAAD